MSVKRRNILHRDLASVILEYESLTIYFVAMELYEGKGQGDTKEFRGGNLPFARCKWRLSHTMKQVFTPLLMPVEAKTLCPALQQVYTIILVQRILPAYLRTNTI